MKDTGWGHQKAFSIPGRGSWVEIPALSGTSLTDFQRATLSLWPRLPYLSNAGFRTYLSGQTGIQNKTGHLSIPHIGQHRARVQPVLNSLLLHFSVSTWDSCCLCMVVTGRRKCNFPRDSSLYRTQHTLHVYKKLLYNVEIPVWKRLCPFYQLLSKKKFSSG